MEQSFSKVCPDRVRICSVFTLPPHWLSAAHWRSSLAHGFAGSSAVAANICPTNTVKSVLGLTHPPLRTGLHGPGGHRTAMLAFINDLLEDRRRMAHKGDVPLPLVLPRRHHYCGKNLAALVNNGAQKKNCASTATSLTDRFLGSMWLAPTTSPHRSLRPAICAF